LREYTDTEAFSARLRERAILSSERKVLIACLSGSKQEQDLSVPVNAQGYGRIRHFRIHKHADWSPNPLPNLPVAKAFRRVVEEVLPTQVFQISACNWHCWYCFVDSALTSANPQQAKYFTSTELVDMFLKEDNRPNVIDLSGGQPDLVPEWVLWTMEAIKERGVDKSIFLWSDDNLSNRYFWKFLTSRQREYIASFPNYSRVACFKGYDEASFAFNTFAEPHLFNQQFEIYRDLLKEGLDMYAYVTFTALPHDDVSIAVERFVDRLQEIHPRLPLRTVPLKIEVYTPTGGRLAPEHKEALAFQHEVHAAWLDELSNRFSQIERLIPISEVTMSL
jgi:uncharacterized Fe-S cluster-containing radical SAM superfamily protein